MQDGVEEIHGHWSQSILTWIQFLRDCWYHANNFCQKHLTCSGQGLILGLIDHWSQTPLSSMVKTTIYKPRTLLALLVDLHPTDS